MTYARLLTAAAFSVAASSALAEPPATLTSPPTFLGPDAALAAIYIVNIGAGPISLSGLAIYNTKGVNLGTTGTNCGTSMPAHTACVYATYLFGEDAYIGQVTVSKPSLIRAQIELRNKVGNAATAVVRNDMR